MLRRPFESGLAALAGEMDHGGRPALAEGHVERFEDYFRTQMGSHGPARDAAAESIEHHGQVEKARPGRNVSDIGNPHGAGCGANEIAVEQIRRPGRAGRSRTVVTSHERRLAPRRLAAFIERATRLRPAWIAAADNSS
jgi:hypothetical protein